MRRILKWFALSAAVIVVVLIALLLSLPLVLDSESFKSAALRHLSRATGGQWQVARLDFDWLPAAQGQRSGRLLRHTRQRAGQGRSIDAHHGAAAAAVGRRARGPHCAGRAGRHRHASRPTPASTRPSGTFTVSDLRAALARSPSSRRWTCGRSTVTIERGRFVLATPGQPSLTLSGIDGHAANHSGRFDVQLTTASDLAQRIDIKVDLDAERFEGSVQLDAADIDLATLLAVAGAQGTGLQSQISLRAKITADSSPALKGTFDAKADNLSIDNTAGKLALQGVALAGQAAWTDSGFELVGRTSTQRRQRCRRPRC